MGRAALESPPYHATKNSATTTNTGARPHPRAVNPTIATSERGIWAVKWSFLGLAAVHEGRAGHVREVSTTGMMVGGAKRRARR